MLELMSHIRKIELRYGRRIFLEGRCHDLAVFLWKHHPEGSIWIGEQRVGNGFTYEHCVYMDKYQESWDILGANAIPRWSKQYDHDHSMSWFSIKTVEDLRHYLQSQHGIALDELC